MPMAPVVQAEWMARTARTMPVEPAGLAAQLPRVFCQPAVALALPEPVVPWHLAEPSAAVELQVLAVQPVAAGP